VFLAIFANDYLFCMILAPEVRWPMYVLPLLARCCWWWCWLHFQVVLLNLLVKILRRMRSGRNPVGPCSTPQQI